MKKLDLEKTWWQAYIIMIHFKKEASSTHSIYQDSKILGQVLFSFGTFDSLSVRCMLLIALPKWPINQFKLVQQNRQKALDKSLLS